MIKILYSIILIFLFQSCVIVCDRIYLPQNHNNEYFVVNDSCLNFRYKTYFSDLRFIEITMNFNKQLDNYKIDSVGFNITDSRDSLKMIFVKMRCNALDSIIIQKDFLKSDYNFMDRYFSYLPDNYRLTTLGSQKVNYGFIFVAKDKIKKKINVSYFISLSNGNDTIRLKNDIELISKNGECCNRLFLGGLK